MRAEEKETKPIPGTVNHDRRRYSRFNVDLPIQYHRIDSPVNRNGRAMNVSEGGMLTYLPEPVETGQHLNLKLFFILGSDFNTIEAKAEVVWKDIYLNEAWGDYRSGMRFMDISDKHMAQLRNYLTTLPQ